MLWIIIGIVVALIVIGHETEGFEFLSKFIIVDKTIINEYTGKVEQKPFEVFTRAVRALNWI